MRVIFSPPSTGPKSLICDAELLFEEDDLLAGLRLAGFSLWRGANGEIDVTFPSRDFGVGSERRCFVYLRGDPAAIERLKAVIIEAFAAVA